jgi:hypothetical protein
MLAGRAVTNDVWIPNAGRLVQRELVHPLRLRFPFIDAIKQEQVLLPILLSLQPTPFFDGYFSLLPRIIWHLWRMRDRREIAASSAARWDLRGEPATGGSSLALSSLFTFGDRRERLRRNLLSQLRNDTTFALDRRDYLAEQTVALVGDGIDFVVTGHTHLERALGSKGRFYYNTGTWTRILRLSPQLLESAEAFSKTFEALDSSDVATLDECKIPIEDASEIPLVLVRPTVLRIVSEPDREIAALCHVFDAPDDGVRLEPLFGSTFVADRRAHEAT